MEVTEHAQLVVSDSSAVGEARRRAVALARKCGLSETDAGRVALVVTEVATNLVKHAGGGELLLRSLLRVSETGVGVLAFDRGPGIANPAEALRDGFSTGGTRGTGLGAIARAASLFELYAGRGTGAALVAEIWPHGAARPDGAVRVGGLTVPHPGESLPGDAWAVHVGHDSTSVIVADGLGHGEHAAEASRAATDTFRRHVGDPPARLLERTHGVLRSTRGAAVAIAVTDRGRGLLRFAGVGNIAATIASGDATRSLVSHHGIVGAAARHFQEFQYPFAAGDLLVLHSDGLDTHWKLSDYPGLAQHDPELVAAVLYRDHRRGRDDTTVVALRQRT
jgi:anti-sigma regulatory factor (Ser/Thr protein kinase)